jgi:hypothetical protein
VADQLPEKVAKLAAAVDGVNKGVEFFLTIVG